MVRRFLSAFLFLTFWCNPAYSDLITIIVCDTVGVNIGGSVKKDLENMRQEACRIALYTEQDLKELIFEGTDIDPRQILAALKWLPSTEDDTILFFFSGHGYRTYSKDEVNDWPNLYLTPAGKGIDYGQVVALLTGRKHKFLLTIADCCNNYMDDAVAPPLEKKMEVMGHHQERTRENYKKLFFYSCGEMIIASSSLSEYSWCNSKGSLFTGAFLEALEAEAEKTSEPSWYRIFDNACSKVVKYQNPVVDFSIK